MKIGGYIGNRVYISNTLLDLWGYKFCLANRLQCTNIFEFDWQWYYFNSRNGGRAIEWCIFKGRVKGKTRE